MQPTIAAMSKLTYMPWYPSLTVAPKRKTHLLKAPTERIDGGSRMLIKGRLIINFSCSPYVSLGNSKGN